MAPRLRFILRFAVIGLALAFVLVAWHPELVVGPRPVVEIRQEAPAPVSAAQPGPAAPLSFNAAVRKAAPAVVNIYSARVVKPSDQLPDDPAMRRFFEQGHPGGVPRRIQTGLGSGVIFSAQGYVLTNHHVIAGADAVEVMLHDGRSARAKLVGSDPETDLAVLKIDLPDLPTITLADSNHLRIGDVVLAIGNPYGVGQTVTQGIVSATGRKRLGVSTYENFIQTDAAINPGNSGGALVNTRGDLVGLNTAIFSRTGGSQGIGFAIPANLSRHVMTQIVEHGYVVRGWLGISMSNLTPDTAHAAGLKDNFGVTVVRVFKDSPAARAGLEPGDVLVRINGQQVYDGRQMLDLVARVKPGGTAVIEGRRAGKPFSTRATVVQRPPASEGE